MRLWSNQSGNGWGALQRLPDFPHLDDLSTVQVVDLLGTGTACLVWSSPLPAAAPRPLQFIDLMGGVKPHLLVNVSNNMGAETRVGYAPSTKFYLADRQAGRPWVTRLPFPVHVVERVEVIDHIARTRFVSRYSYHHGYFDGVEREFRGFAMVEQQDTEAFEDYVAGVVHLDGTQELAPELYQPPVTTRTWYHTGAYPGGDRILHQLRDEYYQQQTHVPEPTLPTGMDDQEYRECVRALKGLVLRQEVYSFDGSAQAPHPYRVTESTYDVTLIQPRAGERPPVFFAYGRESVTHHYERDPADPRVTHTFALDVGPYGNVLKSAAVVYGRQTTDPTLPAEVTRDQRQLHVTYAESDYTPDRDQTAPVPAYRLRTPFESRAYEITGVAPAAGRFTRAELASQIAGAADIEYEVVATGTSRQKRLTSQSKALFRDNALAPMPLGQWDTLGLGFEFYRLAFTPGVVAAYYAGTITDADFAAAGYVHFANDANWWIPSGTSVYPAHPADQFYLPDGTRNALGLESVVTRDKYHLLIERVRTVQAAWNEVRATNDYRVLGPVMVTDPNQNRTAVEIDALGLVVKSAVLGKAGAGEGDTLADPTARMEYELFNWMNNARPNFVHAFAREQHGAANPRWQESYVHFNGSGGVAMVKAQAHAGKALKPNPDGSASEVDADPRWVGNGRTIRNNKGAAVKQYEPYFSTTHEYEDEESLRTIGATPISYYDAVGRNVRTEFPNGTFARVAFDAWKQQTFDPNDTVTGSRWFADRGSPDPVTQPEPLHDPERRAAWLAARHAGTPGTSHFDSLGRPVFAVSDYGSGKTSAVRSEADPSGRYSKTFDQLQRLVASGFTGMGGWPIYGESAERGGRWMFLNVLGALVRAWDEHGRTFRTEYDALHRPVGTSVQEPGKANLLFSYVVYGDRHPEAVQRNLLGTAHQVFDQAGTVRVLELDFKGNPLAAERVLARDYKTIPDWGALAAQPDYAAIQAAAAPALETGEPFTAGSTYDALNRPVRVALHGGTVMVPAFNEANVLASLKVQIAGAGPFVEFLKEQDYDAKGQRQFARYGNDVLTRYFYDPQSFRLTRLLAVKAGDPESDSLQDLRYTYDPVGNITQVIDDAQQTHFFNNAVVKPEGRYEYDALYQLVKAGGREHAGSANDTIRDDRDLDFVPQLPHANDAGAVRNYTEHYEYDLAGNLLKLRHIGGPTGSWTRRYRYAYQDDPADRTNRLTATSRPGDPDAGPYTATYDYDAYGNMTRLRTPTPGELVWSFLDQLQRMDLGGGGTAYYVYSVAGQRVRKVIERQGALRTERIYLGAIEIYRERRGTAAPHFERRTLHISDDTGRIAQVDIKTRDDEGLDPANPLNAPVVRYQYTNHLGSAVLETDADGTVISYEEYHPFGTTAYRSGKPDVNLSLKRYRFSGKERDDESGLYYFGARYYAPWLGRWTSPDPAGFVSGFNLYAYCSNSPIVRSDLTGMDDEVRCYVMHPSLGVPVEAIGTECNQPGVQYVTENGDPIPQPGGGTTPGAGSTTSTGANVVQRHPEGHIHEVAQNFDDAKIAAYRERIQTDRAIATRSEPPGGGSRTDDIRAANQGLRDAYEAGLPGGQRPAGTDIDHTVELQDIGRHNNTVRPQDHRVQNSRLNSSQGSSQQKVNARRIRQGIPEDVPAGAVVRGSEMGNPRIQPRYRSVMRGAGYGLMAVGPFLTLWGASQVENSGVRYTAYGLAGAEVIGGGAYIAGRYFMGGGAAGNPAGLRVMGWGGGLARVAGGGAAILLGTYSLINDFQNENYGVMLGDAASIVAGGALLVGSAPVAAIATGVGVTNMAGDWVETKVTGATGSRTAGVAAGTLAGAAGGAAIGAGIGVWFFGVGAAPGALIGGAIGGIAGFVGAYW